MKKINVCIFGVGNCASSLYQGIHYYSKNKTDGLMHKSIGGYNPDDIKVVCAFDVDKRKVGKSFKNAINSLPNCTPIYYSDVEEGPIVLMNHVDDGVTNIMNNYSDDERFLVSDEKPVNIVDILKEKSVDIVINYLPVGSQKATERIAQACIDAKISFLNCIPVFIASNPVWENKFINAGIPLIGDDMKSQFGASILSQMLEELAFNRGVKVKCHIQRNVGGNTDFLNMVDKSRVNFKKISKENVIRSQRDIRNIKDNVFIHAGPSEYISYYKDNKIANLHLEMEGFMGAPITLDARLSVIDSPNSAGIVIDAIRYLQVAKEMGIKGALRGPSAATQKTPPEQLKLEDALKACKAISERENEF